MRAGDMVGHNQHDGPNRELLELAAIPMGLKKSAYYHFQPRDGWPVAECITHFKDGEPGVKAWAPLSDDGQCAQMEAQLMINVSWELEYVIASDPGCFKCRELYKKHGGDRAKARRRASVRVAAKLGAYAEKNRPVSPEILDDRA